MITSRVDEFKKLHPELKFSHFDFPLDWSGDWRGVEIHFTDSNEVFELDEFTLNSKTRNLLETLLAEIYEDMCDRIFSVTDNH
jgi:hypothetical protein